MQPFRSFILEAAHGRPKTLSTSAFESRYGWDDMIWRGVHSVEGANVTRRGEWGIGDFGDGIYFTDSIAGAQGYAQQTSADRTTGRVLRGAIAAGAKVKHAPKSVAGSDAYNKWFAKNPSVDVLDNDGMYVVRNAAMLVLDAHNYTLPETVVMDYRHKGYTLPDEYKNVIVGRD